jgi:hypothetical protein
MKNLIGGLFDTQEKVNLAYEALQKSGFASEEVNTFVRKPRNRTVRATDVKVQDVAKSVIWGAVILGGIVSILGFLVGIGVISLPALEPSTAPRTPLFIFMSVVWGLVIGGLTGAILGAAVRLLRSKETAEVTTKQIEKSGVLLTVSVNDSQREARARRVLEENGAVEVGNPAEQWDPEAWSSPNGLNTSLKNLVNSR